MSYDALGEYCNIVNIAPGIIELIEKSQTKVDIFNEPITFYSYISSLYGLSLGVIGDFQNGGAFLKKSMDFALNIGDVRSIGNIEFFYACLYLIKGDGKKTIEHSKNAIKPLEEVKWAFLIAMSYKCLGWGFYFHGDLNNAQAYFEKGLKVHIGSKAIWNLAQHYYNLSLIQLEYGKYEKALSYAEEAIKLSMENNDGNREGCSKILMGRILAKMDASKRYEAEKYIACGVKVLEDLNLRPYASQGYFWLGELYSNTGEFDKTVEWLKKAEAEFHDMGMEYDLSFSKSLIGKTLSKINPSQFNQAEHSILDAIKIAQNIESKPVLALGRLCLGEIYADHNQKEKALENLKKAEAMYQEMGMGLWLGKTREVLERLL